MKKHTFDKKEKKRKEKALFGKVKKE